jgi:hypothetical protein
LSLDDSVFLFKQEVSIDKQLDRRTITFVVRLWSEYLEQPSPVWRGEIECVANSNWPGQEQSLESGQRWTFGNLDELLSFLQQQTQSPLVRE